MGTLSHRYLKPIIPPMRKFLHLFVGYQNLREFFMSPVHAFSAGIIFLLTLVVYHYCTQTNKEKDKRPSPPPEPKCAFPIIGHLHLLRGSKPLHKTLASLADKYGPIFMLRTGLRKALVVSNWELAKECLSDDDSNVFADRPKSMSVEIIGYDSSMFSFHPYGPCWSEIRKIVSRELLSNQRVEMLKHIRVSEIDAVVAELHNKWVITKKVDSVGKVVVDMKSWIGDMNTNIILRAVAGKRLPDLQGLRCGNNEANPSTKALREFLDLTGFFMVSDILPFLRWLDIGGYEKTMKKTARDIDYMFQAWLEEHKKKRDAGNVDDDDQRDFMDAMLNILEKPNPRLGSKDSDIIIKSTCFALILGGFDPTSTTLVWALSLLIYNRHTLYKAQDELDKHIGRDRQVNESDLSNLVYLQAILKETLRLYPPAPILAPRESVKDCTIGGYYIPARTRLLINLEKLHRNPQVWTDPLVFKPERFLQTGQKNIDFRGQQFELIPFGAGKRICPGISFAEEVCHLTLAKLLHCFDFEIPGNNTDAVDMTERLGLTNTKATPLEVLVKPRLAPNLYTIS